MDRYGRASEFDETVIQIKRISKKTKGGNTIRFSALVVVGDKKGRVGVGLSKASDVSGAIRKSLGSAGVRDAVGKILGTSNKTSNVYATLKALKTIALIDQRKQNLK